MTSKHASGSSDRSPDLLTELAGLYRVSTTFKGWDGGEQQVSPETLQKVLGALGVKTGSEAELEQSLEQARTQEWLRTLPPTVVVRRGSEYPVPVHLAGRTDARAWITLEDGSELELDLPAEPENRKEIGGELRTRTLLVLPDDLPLGWHRLSVEGPEVSAQAVLVVTPERLDTAQRLVEHRQWGLMAQLYSVRSSRSWGIGDLADLADLTALAGAGFGAGYVLINPLHAAEPGTPVEPSPYLPTTRRFFNPLYIRVEDIPEYAYLPDGEHAEAVSAAASFSAANRSAEQLDRDSTFAAKLSVLETVYKVPRSLSREQQFEAFCSLEGKGLDDFALWCALAEQFPEGAPEWKKATGPDSAFAQEQRERLADRIGFFKWLQFICDEQLEAVQRAARKAGMDIGVVHDLAVGVHPSGADAWMLRDVLAPGVSVGAPPDMFNQRGQDWSQPPWHPRHLAESGYAAYRNMLRTILRHAGGIRVDHILGLFRLWWIPSGSTPGEGAYVNYDHEALIGILALEAQRAGAVVIGEDLGVFEPWVQDYLGERGVLGTSILWFEQTEDGPRPPEDYRLGALTSVNTHDLPPTAGYLAGEHVDLRESLGLLNRPVEEERAADSKAQEEVLDLVRSRGLLGKPDADQRAGSMSGSAIQETVEALYAFIAQTPSVLLGVALADAVGEKRTQNQPGTADEYPNWRVPLCGPDGEAVLLDDLAANPRFTALASLMGKALED